MLVFAWVQFPHRRLAWLPGVVHGATGVTATGIALAGLRGPARGVASGAEAFGVVAVVLMGIAVLFGGLLAAARLRRRRPSILVMGVHATFAVAGLVLLAAYLSVPA